MEKGTDNDNKQKKYYEVTYEKWQWDEQKAIAAKVLGEGYTQKEAAEAAGVSHKTVWNWQNKSPEFAAEVDRCSMMFDVASKAHRNRLLMKAIRQFVREDGNLRTGDDTLLDYIKEARMNTDGVKVDILTQLAAIDAEAGSVAGSGSTRSNPVEDEEEYKADRYLAAPGETDDVDQVDGTG